MQISSRGLMETSSTAVEHCLCGWQADMIEVKMKKQIHSSRGSSRPATNRYWQQLACMTISLTDESTRLCTPCTTKLRLRIARLEATRYIIRTGRSESTHSFKGRVSAPDEFFVQRTQPKIEGQYENKEATTERKPNSNSNITNTIQAVWHFQTEQRSVF